MEARGTTGEAATARSNRTSSRPRADTESGCTQASGTNLRCRWRHRECRNENGENNPVQHLLVRFNFGRQPEINAAIVVFLRRRGQVQFGERNFMMTTWRQVVQRIANHSIILNFELVTVLEDQQRLGLVGNWSVGWRVCLGLGSRLRTAWPLGIGVCYIRAGGSSGTAPVENSGSATVVLFALGFGCCSAAASPAYSPTTG